MMNDAFAWIPPRPGTEVAAHWESVHALRQRLGIEFNYTPSLLHPEICRHMTPEECQRGDESMVAHAKSHRALQNTIARGHNPNLGTFKVRIYVLYSYFVLGLRESGDVLGNRTEA